jgi:cellulose synthase/poly-beta-1,6-N-acetylglucosamine synthase-like glycosyltransferase
VIPFSGSALVFPFSGVPWAAQSVLIVAFAVIVAMCVWTATLFVRGQRSIARAPAPRAHGADAFTWVFLVAALNEEITIGDSVERLLALEVAHRQIIVIDDGSDDRTPEILAGIRNPDLTVLRRELPNARTGKGQGLNAAYQQIGRLLPLVDRDRIIVVVVDADGRVSPDALPYVAAHFDDPEIGGVQALVRIYNRGGFLTNMQDVEFSIYGHVYQAGKNREGTAGMGGNGQFNRLSALDSVVEGAGPWRDRLTEDQDLGIRLLAAGWRSHQETRAQVYQQGVPRLRPLLRQRTRWAQGNMQSIGLAGAMLRAPFALRARLEESLYLFMPLWQSIVGLGFVTAVVLWATGSVSPLPAAESIPLVYLLGFSNGVLGCVAARQASGWRGWAWAVAVAHLYALYTWILFPVIVRALLRQVTTRRDWARTDREPLRGDSGLAG